MDRNEKIRERLELALKPTKPPTLEEVLEQVSRHGVLRGPVDWVFPAWMLYVEYATQRIAETFPLSEEEKKQLFHFRDTLKRLLLEAWMQAKEKLTTLYKAVVGGTYRVEGNKLYAPDGTWMYVRGDSAPYIIIHGVTAETYFPDLLKISHQKLELLQLGWRASDEGNKKGRPFMGTTRPWQVFAWAAVRYGKFRIRIVSVNLTREGVSIHVYSKAKSWKQKWSKNEAIDLVADYLRRGEWAPLLTAWLGDGEANQKKVLHSRYELVIAAKEPWRLGNSISTKKALIASGKEAFRRLRESASVYGELLDLLKAHKWISIKLATDDSFKVAFKLKMNITIEGIVMYLRLVGGRDISLLAGYITRDVRKALAAVDKLRVAGLRPNIVRSGSNYMVYIATADLLKLAEKDETIRRTIALYLAEKAKNGTPRQREIAEKLLKRYPLFSTNRFAAFSALPCVSGYRTQAPSLANMWNCRADDSQHRPASSHADNSQKSQVALYGVLKGLGQQFFAPFYAAGGLFFLYLAYRIGTAKPPQEGSAGWGHPLRGYLLGLSLGLVNPYQVGWWLTAGLSSIAHFGVEWAAGLFLAILTWIIAFPAAVRSGWRLNSRLTWLTIKFFSAAVLVVFGALYIYTAAMLVLSEG
jgi:hypothetical protein